MTSIGSYKRTFLTPAEARDLLTPVYGWYTEGFDIADPNEAKALLGELE